jgi:hypothetical protein
MCLPESVVCTRLHTECFLQREWDLNSDAKVAFQDAAQFGAAVKFMCMGEGFKSFQAPIVAAPEFEFRPSESGNQAPYIALPRAAIDVNAVFPAVSAIRPHIPTVAKAFRELLRNCSDPPRFQSNLQQLWKALFHIHTPSDFSSQPEFLMLHHAAFEFAINELLLACEEYRYLGQNIEASKAFAPLEFLKLDSGFLAFTSIQFGVAAPVSSVRAFNQCRLRLRC